MPARAASRIARVARAASRRRRVGEVAEDREVDVRIEVAERQHLEVLEQRRHRLGARQHRRHDDHRARVVGNAGRRSRGAAAGAAGSPRRRRRWTQRDRDVGSPGRAAASSDRDERASRRPAVPRVRRSAARASSAVMTRDRRRGRASVAWREHETPHPLARAAAGTRRRLRDRGGRDRSGDSRRGRRDRRSIRWRPPGGRSRPPCSATRTCASPLGAASSSTACRCRSRLRKSIRPYAPAGSRCSTCSTRLTDSKYSRQSSAEQSRRLVIALATDTCVGRLALVLAANRRLRRSSAAPRGASSTAVRIDDSRSPYSRMPMEQLHDERRRRGAAGSGLRRRAPSSRSRDT